MLQNRRYVRNPDVKVDFLHMANISETSGKCSAQIPASALRLKVVKQLSKKP